MPPASQLEQAYSESTLSTSATVALPGYDAVGKGDGVVVFLAGVQWCAKMEGGRRVGVTQVARIWGWGRKESHVRGHMSECGSWRAAFWLE